MSIDAQEERTLVSRILKGERRLFEVLVDRYSGLAWHYFYGRCGRDAETARDLVQEAFAKAWSNLAGFRGEASFKSWLMTICRNMAINHWQHRQIEQKFAEASAVPEGTDDFSGAAIDRELVAGVLSKLTQVQRDVVEMKYFWELGCGEIAQQLGLPEGTVKSHLFYARARLLELLQEKETRK